MPAWWWHSIAVTAALTCLLAAARPSSCQDATLDWHGLDLKPSSSSSSSSSSFSSSNVDANAHDAEDSIVRHVVGLKQLLPPKLQHTLDIEWANAAAASYDWASWTRHINAFLEHYKTSPIRIMGIPFEGHDGAGPPGADGELAGDDACLDSDFISCLASAAPVRAVPCGPMVSVIMVAHNAAPTIIPAVFSILDQTWRRLELVIVDDASTDTTWSVIHRLQASDPRIRLLRNRIQVGPYVSRNRALLQAVRGSYVTGHDADDWAHPARLESQVRVLLESGGRVRANVAYMLRVKPDGQVSTSSQSWFSPDGVAKIAMVSAMFERRLLMEELGYWDSVHYGGDAEMIGRAMTLLGAGFVEVPIISMLCRDRSTGLGKSGYNAPEAAQAGASHGPAAGGQGAKASTWKKSIRALYRESFTGWHARIPGTRNAHLPFVHSPRRFHATDSMIVPPRLVRLLLTSSRKVLFRGQPQLAGSPGLLWGRLVLANSTGCDDGGK